MQTVYGLVFMLFSCVVFSQEICNNGIDDDGDGKIDLNDSDCICNTSGITSIIPNHSFEEHTGCPTTFSTPGDDQLGLAMPWIQATNATSDYHNKCGYVMPAIESSGLLNFPDGNAVAGAIFLPDWKEYLGTPLLSPMVAGTSYELTFKTAFVVSNNYGELSTLKTAADFEMVNITLYGCANINNLPVNTQESPNLYDPTWVEVGHVSYTPVTAWGDVTITFTPTFDINAIMIGSPEVLPPSYNTSDLGYISYFLYDNLLLNTASSFGVNISQTGNYCQNNLVLSANLTNTFSGNETYQWYKNGIAILGATGTSYSVPPISTSLGVYSVMVSDGGSCFVSSGATINNSIAAPTATIIQPNCLVNSGTITITETAAQYSFDNGVTWQNGPVKSGLAPGTYFIKIRTANGCLSGAAGVTIPQPNLLSSSEVVAIQPTTCNGTGTITVNSAIAMQYSFDNGVTWSTSNTASNLVPGDYLVKIKDANGCESAAVYRTIYRIFTGYPQYTAVQPECGLGGSITITTLGSEYSFDDGVTWVTSNTLGNLDPDSYHIRVRDALGCESNTEYVYLFPYYSNEIPTFTSVNPVCGAGGSITITSAGSLFSFDGGDTWTANPTLSNLNPGYYYLQFKNSQGCISSTAYTYLEDFYLPDPLYTAVNPSCGNIGKITITSVAAQYSFNNGTTWGTSNVANNLAPGYHYIKIRNGAGCESEYVSVYLDPDHLAKPEYTVVQPDCLSNGSITITTPASAYSFDGGVTWTNNPVFSNLQPGNSYHIVIKNALGCTSIPCFVAIDPFYLTQNYNQIVCDDGNDGIEYIPLSNYHSQILISNVSNSFSYYSSLSGAENQTVADLVNANYALVTGLNTIYVRIDSDAGCHKIAVLQLTLVDVPVIAVNETEILCEHQSIVLHAGSGFDSYIWSSGETTPSITIIKDGNYSVTVTQNHDNVICSTTKNFKVVLSNPATITKIETLDWTDYQNNIGVFVEGLGNYEYSLDGVHYQDSNAFYGLTCGEYVIYVHDKFDCGTVTQDVFLLMYPKFFTPNDDTYHDLWKVKFSEDEPGMTTAIFDREGKLITKLKYNEGWDGKYHGEMLPANDYWFVATRANGKEYRGHFALKR